jgi:hypothetical protein
MPVTFPITAPTDPDAKVTTIQPRSAVAMSESPFSFAQQVQEHQGQQWRMVVQLPTMVRVKASEWVAFLTRLNGRAGTFLYAPPTWRIPQGSDLGAPVIAGAGQIGTDINTSGWTPNELGVLLRGDFVQFGSSSSARLHMIQDDVDADGGGLATLILWPRVRAARPDLEAIVTTNPVGLWRLATNEMEWNVNDAQHFGIAFPAVEVVP